MGDAIGVVMSVILAMSILGIAGYKIAKDQNRNPFIGLALSAVIPLVGIGLLLLLRPKSKRQGG